MTVGELIAELKKYPDASLVVIPGYEGGFDDASPVASVSAIIDENADPEGTQGKRDWYYGKHAEEDGEGSEHVVLIGRAGRP